MWESAHDNTECRVPALQGRREYDFAVARIVEQTSTSKPRESVFHARLFRVIIRPSRRSRVQDQDHRQSQSRQRQIHGLCVLACPNQGGERESNALRSLTAMPSSPYEHRSSVWTPRPRASEPGTTRGLELGDVNDVTSKSFSTWMLSIPAPERAAQPISISRIGAPCRIGPSAAVSVLAIDQPQGEHHDHECGIRFILRWQLD